MEHSIAWALALLSAFLGIKWQSSAKENATLKERLSPNKEKLYSDILEFQMDYLRKDVRPSQNDFKEKMVEFEKSLLLNSSNAVLLAYGDYMQNFFDEKIADDLKSNRTFVLLGNLIIEMRKDLGHSKFMNSLFWFDPLRLWIKDVDTIIPESKKGFRLQVNKVLNREKKT